MGFINEQCDITVCGELKHGKGNVAEEQTRKECMGHELVVLGDEYAGAGTIKAWADSGMKFMGVAKGTPATVDYRAIEEAGLELSYTPGRNRVAVAEFNIGLMICAARKICLAGTGLQKGEHLGQAVQEQAAADDLGAEGFHAAASGQALPVGSQGRQGGLPHLVGRTH